MDIKTFFLQLFHHKDRDAYLKLIRRLLVPLALSIALLLILSPMAINYLKKGEIPGDLYLDLVSRANMQDDKAKARHRLAQAMLDDKITFVEYFRLKKEMPIDGRRYVNDFIRGESHP
jgi:hypothetical protein